MTARLMRAVIDSLEGRMCILSADGTIVDSNSVWDELAASLGLPSADTGPNFFTMLPALGLDSVDELTTAIEGVLSGATRDAAVKQLCTRKDVTEYVVVRMHAIRNHDLARAVVTIIDITQAMANQQEFRRISQQAELLALVAKHTDNAVVITDSESRIEWVNEAFSALTGYSFEEAAGQLRNELWHGSPPPTSGEVAIDVEVPAETKTGVPYWTHLQVQPVYGASGEITKFVSLERDVTQRRQVEEQLRLTNKQASALAEELSTEKSILSGVLAAIPHLVYWKDRQLRYVGVNQAFLTTRGLDGETSVIDHSESELGLTDGLSEVLSEVEDAVLTGASQPADRRVSVTSRDGTRHDLLLNILPRRHPTDDPDERGMPVGVIGVAADVTHISDLERQLAQASRLESIGQLAAGIAHEINTPVQYVTDNTRFVADAVSELLSAMQDMTTTLATVETADDPVAACRSLRSTLDSLDLPFLSKEIPSAISQSQEGLVRVSEIVKAMKEFSHPGTGRIEVDINRAVASTTQVCRNEWRYIAEVELELDPDLPMVSGFEGELKQVLLNILVNAAQAIGDDPARPENPPLGLIQITTSYDDEQAFIVIADNGPGMDETIQRRIFDPFFTTKDVGKGTGQGLSMAYSIIVQKHGGTLAVKSAPGQGATFTLGLPRKAAG